MLPLGLTIYIYPKKTTLEYLLLFSSKKFHINDAVYKSCLRSLIFNLGRFNDAHHF